MERPWLLSTVVALATILVGVVLVLVLAPDDDNQDAAASANARAGKQSGAHVVTTTTTGSALDPTTTTTTAPAAGDAPAGTSTNPGGATATTVPVVLPAFDQSDPPDPTDAYQRTTYPPGVTSTITSCTWSPANGGRFSADGALTNSAGEDDDWLVSAVWLWRNVNQDEDINQQSSFVHAEVGQTTAWHLTIDAPNQPPNLSCALEID